MRVPGSNPGGTIFITYSIILFADIYLFLFLISVGSYQVGYTRSHPNTEVKMLRACSVPLCSHRWERQVIYLLLFFINLIQYIQREYVDDIMKLYQDDYIDTRDAMLYFTIGDCDEVYFI